MSAEWKSPNKIIVRTGAGKGKQLFFLYFLQKFPINVLIDFQEKVILLLLHVLVEEVNQQYNLKHIKKQLVHLKNPLFRLKKLLFKVYTGVEEHLLVQLHKMILWDYH